MLLREISYGDDSIAFEVIPRPRRRTLGIEVHPNGSVKVLSPTGCAESLIQKKVRQRAPWISRQLAAFARYEQNHAPRHYLSGETHRYLGRLYRLRTVVAENSTSGKGVKLIRGEMLVASPGRSSHIKTKALLKSWYTQRAREVFEEVLSDVFGAFERRGYARPKITVREMQSRWGSLSPSQRMTLNAKLIEVPKPCIEYVIVHELCHLVHRNHTPEFFKLLSRSIPDWQVRKHRLESALQ